MEEVRKKPVHQSAPPPQGPRQDDSSARLASLEQRQQTLLRRLLLAVLAAGGLVTLTWFLSAPALSLSNICTHYTTALFFLALPALFLLTYRVQYKKVVLALVLTISLIIYVEVLCETTPNRAWMFSYLIVPIIIGGMFLAARVLSVVITLNLIALLLLPLFTPQFNMTELPTIFFGLTSLLVLLAKLHREALQRAAENQLRYSRESYRAVTENAPALICRFLPDDAIVFANDLLYNFFITTPESLLGTSFYSLIPEESEAALRQGIRTLTPENPEHSTQLPYSQHTGEHRWLCWRIRAAFDSRGELIACQAVGTDITTNRRAEQALRESEERFRTLYENAPLLIDAFTPEGACILWNKQCRESLGWTIEEINAHENFLASIYPDPKVREAVIRAVIEAPDGQFNEWRLQSKAGKILTMRWANFKLPDGTVIGIGHDITKEKEAEEEKAVLETQLRQSQKMEAVGQLAGGVAHDFNNLLQAIIGYGEMAREDTPQQHPAYPSIAEILHAADRAKILVSQLLAFSRRQVLEMTNLDLNDVIANLLKIIRRVIGEHIQLEVLYGHNLGQVRADRGQMEQILMNLCVNARDAMPDGGKITIETENVRIDQAYCDTHPWAAPGRYILLSVTDTGCGMDEQTRPMIFEPFFTTKDVGEGTGLGLSTVYGLVKQHDGFIHLYSELNQGTTFKIYLPLTERKAEDIGSKIKGPVPRGVERILIAEDDERVRKLSERILSNAGYSVLTAEDGERALEHFEAPTQPIDLAILDVMMPKLGGRAVFDVIREKAPHTRVLFSSGYSMNAIHTNFILDEGLSLIQKPYQNEELLRRVRQVLDNDNGTPHNV